MSDFLHSCVTDKRIETNEWALLRLNLSHHSFDWIYAKLPQNPCEFSVKPKVYDTFRGVFNLQFCYGGCQVRKDGRKIWVTNYSSFRLPPTVLVWIYRMSDDRESTRTELMAKSKSEAEMDFYDCHHQHNCNKHSQYTKSTKSTQYWKSHRKE